MVQEAAGAGIDSVEVDFTYTLGANVENLYLQENEEENDISGTGNELDNLIVGNDGDNTLSGLAGNDTLDGGEGEDVMTGGTGDDTFFVDNEYDVTAEAADEGHDTVYSTQSHELGDNLEDLYLTGDENSYGEGNDLANLIVGDESYNELAGLGGDDVLHGNGGDDSLYGDEGDDALYGGDGFDYLDGFDGDDVLDGGLESDSLNAGDGNDLLQGGEGSDNMYGGLGDDVYYVDSDGDQVNEFEDEGIDTVYEENIFFYSTPTHVDNVTVIGDYADLDDDNDGDAWVWGNDLDNIFIGHDGDNRIHGFDGADTIDGRAGGDSLYGDSDDDVIYGGDDALRRRSIYIDSYGEEVPYWWENAKQVFIDEFELAANADDIEGGDGDDQIDGGSGNDEIYGDSGDDFIYGGADGLIGDVIGDGGEGGGGDGEDEGGETEDGRVFHLNDDRLFGDYGDDVLDGGSGDDDIYGGEGDDTLYGGADGPLNRSNDDYLDGGGGIDFMAGGTGDDEYIVDGFFEETTDIPVYGFCGEEIEGAVTRLWTTDTVLESGGEGYDRVYSFADYTLGDNVEELQLAWFSGYAPVLFGRGNAGDNTILGNGYDNRLEGAAGNDFLSGDYGDDVLDGGAGNDVLNGGAGDDTYLFGPGAGRDIAYSYGGGTDRVRLTPGFLPADVVLSRQGDSVIIGLPGSGDSLRLDNWFGSSERVSTIEFCDADPWDEEMIEQLANARVDQVAAEYDFAEVSEDDVQQVSGNLLDNDTAYDAEATLRVDGAGVWDGDYGSLEVGASGAYVYTLDNDDPRIQALGAGETAYELFGYEAVDTYGSSAPAALEVLIYGSNDAPTLGEAGGGEVTEDAGEVEIYSDENLLQNSWFDSGFDDWTLEGNTDFSGINFFFYGPTAYFGAQEEPTLLWQEVETFAGERYLLEFDLIGGGQDGAEVSVQWNGETVIAIAEAGDEEERDFTHFQLELQGTGDDSRLEFALRNDQGFWYLDDVKLGLLQEYQSVFDEQEAEGTATFDDVDVNDGHEVLVEAQGDDYAGFLYAYVDEDSFGDNIGSLNWFFSAENDSLQFLAEGETREQVYDLTIDDGHGGTATQSVTITLHGVNDAPEFEDTYVLATEDVEPVVGGNVLDNVYDVDAADVLSVTTPGSHAGLYGTLTLAADGGYTYALDNDSLAVQSLNAGDYLEDAFVLEFEITDGIATGLPMLHVAVAGTNDAPVAQNDSATVREDGALIASGNLLANDSDVDSGAYLLVLASGVFDGAYGTLEVLDDGSYTYVLDNGAVQFLGAGQSVVDSFAYEATDGDESSAATLNITINGVNDSPLAADDAADVAEDGVLVATGNVLTSNDQDPDAGDLLSVVNPGTYVGSFGTLELAGDGSYSYVLDNGSVAVQSLSAGEVVEDSFEYAATDGLATTGAFLTITAAGANDAPIAQDDVVQAGEDGDILVGGNVLANDSDVDAADTPVVADAGVRVGAYGTLTLGTDGVFEYQLDNDALSIQSLRGGQSVSDVFAYSVTDGMAADGGSLIVQITGANDNPDAVDDEALLSEDGPLATSGNVLGNDSDIDAGTVLAVANAGTFAGVYGTLALAVDGSYTYSFEAAAQTLGQGEVATDTFVYLAADDDASPLYDAGILRITLSGANDAPVTVADLAVVQEDVTSTAAGNVLANDSDVDATDALSVSNAGTYTGAFGTLTLAADGGYSYELDSAAAQSLAEGEQRTETFAYLATDGIASTPGALSIEVLGTNDAPVFGSADLAATVTEDNGLPGPAVLGADGSIAFNDVDLSDLHEVQIGTLDSGYLGEFSAQIVADSTGGGAGGVQWSFSVDNGALDAMGEGETREQSYEVLVDDGHGGADARIVTVTLAGVNDAPVAADDAAAVQEDGTLVAAGNVLGNDSDVDLNSLLQISSPGSFSGTFGTLTLAADGSYSYALDNAAAQSLAAGQSLQDVFSYEATDGVAISTAALTVTIDGANDAPVTQDDSASVQEDGAFVASGNLLANDSDVDGGTTLTVANAGLYGSLNLSANGDYTYTLDNASTAVQSLRAGQSVTDTFSYAASDGIASTAGSLVVTVNGTNDDPVANNDTGAAQEDGPAVTLLASMLLANDTDADAGDTKAITAVSNSAAGATVTLSGGNAVYNVGGLFQTLRAGATTTDTFSYTMVDAVGAASTAMVTMTITGVNDAPVLAVPIADQNAAAGTAFTFSFAAGTFTDIDAGDTLSYAASLSDGSALPSWLAFDAATRTFAGTPPGTPGGGTGEDDCGCGTDGGTAPATLDLRVTATDTAGASAQDAFVLNIAGGSSGGSGIVPIVGTDHDDVIAGTSGDDVIDGRRGYDKMTGGAGDDVYYVDKTGSRVDLVTEGATSGYDTVYSSASYTLGSNVEELHLIGDDNLEGKGNSLANMVIGNAGDNKLYGEAGNDLLLDDEGEDRLDGGAGDDVLDGGVDDDTLIGGAGNDLFVHTAGGGDDVVQDSGGTDAIRFGTGIGAGNVTVRRDDKDLVLRLSGGNGSVTVKDWFASSAKRVEEVQFADGTVWNEAAIRARIGSGNPSGGSGHGGSQGDHNGYCDDRPRAQGNGHDRDDDGYDGHHGGRHDHKDHHGGHGGGCGGDDCGSGAHSDLMRDAIGQRLKHNPDYDFTALAQYLQRNGGGGYGAMTAQQVAQRWSQVQNCVGSLATMDNCGDDDCGGGHGGGHGCDDDRGGHGGWGHSGSTGQSRGCGGMNNFSGLGEGFRRL